MIVYGQNERCGEWARKFIPHVKQWGEWYQTIGLERDGALNAVVVFNYYTECDIAMHIAAIPGKRWMNKQFLKAVFAYPFFQLGVKRITGYVPRKNIIAQRFDEHIGFKREGLMRQALPNDDIIVFGMLKSECRFLYENSSKRHIRLVSLSA